MPSPPCGGLPFVPPPSRTRALFVTAKTAQPARDAFFTSKDFRNEISPGKTLDNDAGYGWRSDAEGEARQRRRLQPSRTQNILNAPSSTSASAPTKRLEEVYLEKKDFQFCSRMATC